MALVYVIVHDDNTLEEIYDSLAGAVDHVNNIIKALNPKANPKIIPYNTNSRTTPASDQAYRASKGRAH